MDPKEFAIEQIDEAVAGLRAIVTPCSTSALAGACLLFNLKRKPEDIPALRSPARQWSFLLGLLLHTPEPATPKDFEAEDQKSAERLLNQAFSAYSLLYYPSPEERAGLSEEWWHMRAVAMPAFLNFFNTRLLATPEQVAERIRRYVAPFDAALQIDFGVSATQATAICDWIWRTVQTNLDETAEAAVAEREARLCLLDEAEKQGWGIDEIRAAAAEPAYRDKLMPLLDGMLSTGSIRYADLRTSFPNTAESFWQRFTVGRGEGPDLRFPTERSIIDDRPLVRTSADEAMCPSINVLYLAVLEASERCLLQSTQRAAFFRARDQALEDEAAEHFTRLLRGRAVVHRGLYETSDRHHEHDLVIRADGLCLIAEAKASRIRPDSRGK